MPKLRNRVARAFVRDNYDARRPTFMHGRSSGVARGLACHAENVLNFFKPKFFLAIFLQENDEMLSHVMSSSKTAQANQIPRI